ncbi:MFS transporter [Actinoplanes sp. OR16]|uniref:MFS transporter n=1 Tax=Actinoplanes sp. OR16 TaxID=946334 RepID=UPI000F6E43E3|nr:MFS transporter [Actinoplanes sp. OR16]BBH66496.1 MFS transporter [Actinoplanes sp. OR16]
MADAVTQSEGSVTFREIFALREFRALFLSNQVNGIGDYLSRAAVTALVFHQSRSALLSAIAFAISYVPWIFGPLLSALAERYPYRRVMITSDLCRMVLIGLLLLPGLPVAVMFLLLFASGLGAPPARSARSAMLPLVVRREHLTLALATNQTSGQAAQVIGYLAGATLSVALTPRIALGIDVLTFAVSAALVAFGIRRRPTEVARSARTHLLGETSAGFRLVFGDRVLRTITLVVLTMTVFAIVPEGLAAAWAGESTSGPAARGLDQGMIMAAGPLGFVIGGVLFNRLVPAARRIRLVPLLAVIAPLLLVPSLAGPPAEVVALLVLLAGTIHGAIMPTLNATFVLALPNGFRARAFGVVNSGVQLTQFSAVIITGTLADSFRLPVVVGLWSIGGTLAMLLIAIFWPRPTTFADAAERAAEAAGHGQVPAARKATTSVTPDAP